MNTETANTNIPNERAEFSKELAQLKAKYPKHFKTVDKNVRRKIKDEDKIVDIKKPYEDSLKKIRIADSFHYNFLVEKSKADQFRELCGNEYGKDSGAMSILFRLFIDSFIQAQNMNLIKAGVMVKLFEDHKKKVK